MIVITGNNGEGSGTITNYAVEKLLEENPRAFIMLLDDTGEFKPLIDKLNGIQIHFGSMRKPFEEQMQFCDDSRLFQLTFDEPLEYNLEKIKRLEKKLSDEGKWVFVIFKSTDKDYSYFIQNEYEKL